jgi:hypothetical protein
MKMSRRIGAVVVAAVAAVGMASIGTASAASAAPHGPQPVSSWLHAVKANTGTWVNVAWRTDRRICDAKIRFSGDRIGIDYPGRRNYTTFSRGNSLKPGRTDFTTVEVTPNFDRAGIALLRATIEYDSCTRRARTQRMTTTLTLPVLRNGHGTVIGNGGHGNAGQGDGGHSTGGQGNAGQGDAGQGDAGHSGGQGNGGHSGGQGNGGHSGGQGDGGHAGH